MPKKSVNDQPVTKKDFQSLRSEFGGLRSEFKATKKSLFSQILTLEERVERVEGKIDQADEKNKKYKDEILTGLDKVMRELQAMREENAAGTLQLRRLREDINGHEERISKLESISH